MKQLSEDLIRELRAIDSPTIANAIESFCVRSDIEGFTGPAIRCLTPTLSPVLGYAVTATVDSTTPSKDRERAMLEFFRAIMESPKPVVVALKSEGLIPSRTCVIGEMISRTMQKMGAVGLVTDGCVRDLEPLRQIGFMTFGIGSMASHGIPSLRKVNLPIDVDGMLVEPGDLIHGDENGVVKIPWACIDGLLDAAKKVLEGEQQTIRNIDSPDFPASVKDQFGINEWK
ncbi:MAG: hypothetical protein HYX78_12825 [Armatimonadetes bacterium]|nr:hypothetical protein [Armatimonadota bacterium]